MQSGQYLPNDVLTLIATFVDIRTWRALKITSKSLHERFTHLIPLPPDIRNYSYSGAKMRVCFYCLRRIDISDSNSYPYSYRLLNRVTKIQQTFFKLDRDGSVRQFEYESDDIIRLGTLIFCQGRKGSCADLSLHPGQIKNKASLIQSILLLKSGQIQDNVRTYPLHPQYTSGEIEMIREALMKEDASLAYPDNPLKCDNTGSTLIDISGYEPH